MPRENRKRGKKNNAKTVSQDDCKGKPDKFHSENELQNFPERGHEGDSEDLPFGVLDPDLKAYFRTVDNQLRNWQQEAPQLDIEANVDPNEERTMFFTAALSEMNGKELLLATDPDCSSILERMLYSMDDFVRRVFTDRLAGSWSQLITNRFASHVCQTLFTVAADTVARETRGILPSLPVSSGSSGELLTMTQLILNACEDILPELSSLIQNAFASHVLRALFLLLAPTQLTLSRSRLHKHAPFARSKRSALWKARRGPMKAMITNNFQIDSNGATKLGVLPTPHSFPKIAKRFVEQILKELGGNEVRALAVDKVASPSLQMLLQMEAAFGMTDSSGSIMGHLLMDFVTDAASIVNSSASSYVNTLFFDSTSSHLLECIFACCSSNVFDRLWDCYVHVDLPRLATHPVANFVVACGVEKLDHRRLGDAVAQLKSTWNRSFRLSRMGVLTAMIDRAGQIGAHEAELVEAVCSMAEVNRDEERKNLVPCILQLRTRTEYLDTISKNKTVREGELDPSGEVQGSERDKIGSQGHMLLEPKVQGSVLLQSLLRLHDPYNHVVLESLYSLLPAELLALAQNPTSSRIFDAAFESPSVPLRSRKRLVTAFIGHYHLLSDDRIGSRVADRCWDVADPYLKEKIARSLIPQEHFLTGSHFGRFFARRLSLPLLQRKPDQWKALQSKNGKPLTNSNAIFTPQTKRSEADIVSVPSSSSKRELKRKREIVSGDEIDALFSSIAAMKRVRGIPETGTEAELSNEKPDGALDAVLDAIKAIPSDTLTDPRRRNKR